MLPPFIIEQIRKREEERRAREERVVLELPLDNPHDYHPSTGRVPSTGPGAALDQDQEPKRGVIVLDL